MDDRDKRFLFRNEDVYSASELRRSAAESQMVRVAGETQLLFIATNCTVL